MLLFSSSFFVVWGWWGWCRVTGGTREWMAAASAVWHSCDGTSPSGEGVEVGLGKLRIGPGISPWAVGRTVAVFRVGDPVPEIGRSIVVLVAHVELLLVRWVKSWM